MTRRKTDGERISTWVFNRGYDEIRLAARIDRLLRKRMSEAWEEGWFDRDCQEADWHENPYRGRASKAQKELSRVLANVMEGNP